MNNFPLKIKLLKLCYINNYIHVFSTLNEYFNYKFFKHYQYKEILKYVTTLFSLYLLVE